MRGRLSLVRRSASSGGRSERGLPATSLRERLTRLGAPPRPRPQRSYELPRGFDQVMTAYGIAAVRKEGLALPPLDPYPGTVAYLDTETTGLTGGPGASVFCRGN